MATFDTRIDARRPDPRAARTKAMRVLHVYTEHRSKGGAERLAEFTMDISRRAGLKVDSFVRSSDDLPQNLVGKIQAGFSAIDRSASLRQFAAAADAFQPDIVHLYDYFPLISPWIAPFCAERGIPIILYCVHYRLTCPVATHYTHGEVCTRCTGGREYWAVLRNCRQNLCESITVALHSAMTRKFEPLTGHITKFIAPSDFTKEWLIQHAGVAPARITTVMPFVDHPETAADPSAGGYVAYAGRFAEEKGIPTLLAAAGIAKLPIRLSRNEKYLAQIALPASVEQVITRTREELHAFYRGARMLVVPSEWFETFAMVGAEAMSYGIPVVAARIGALTNLVDDEVNGLLFEPGDAADLARQMLRLWNDPALCRRLGAAARQKALDQWTTDHYFNRLNEVYEEISSPK